MTLWESDKDKDVVIKTLWKRRYGKAVVRKTLWERRCEKNLVRKALWEILWEIHCEKEVLRKALWDRRYFMLLKPRNRLCTCVISRHENSLTFGVRPLNSNANTEKEPFQGQRFKCFLYTFMFSLSIINSKCRGTNHCICIGYITIRMYSPVYRFAHYHGLCIHLYEYSKYLKETR